MPVARFGARFWFRWYVFGGWCRWSVLGLGFGSGGPFWGSILVPVVRFGASFWCRWSVFGPRFWCRWSVLGLHFGAGGPFLGLRWLRFGGVGPFLGLHCGAGGLFLRLHCGTGSLFWGFVLVPVVRFEAPFWCLVVRYSGSMRFGDPFWGSILVPVVRFGAPFSGASFLDLLWLRGASVLDLLWLPGARFWTLASRCSFLGPRVRAWTFAPYHFRIPLYMFQVIKPSPIC